MQVSRAYADAIAADAFADAYGMEYAYTSDGMVARKGVASNPSVSKVRAKIRSGTATSATDAVANDPAAFSISSVKPSAVRIDLNNSRFAKSARALAKVRAYAKRVREGR